MLHTLSDIVANNISPFSTEEKQGQIQKIRRGSKREDNGQKSLCLLQKQYC